MRVIIQRAKAASCTVDNKVVSEIKNGYLLLVGLTHTDTLKDVEYLAKRIAKIRLFEDENGKMNKSILELNYEILSISQFTLYANTLKGNRPSFTKAMASKEAKNLYETLAKILNEEYHIKTFNGIFGEYMEISLINDGPVTITLESK